MDVKDGMKTWVGTLWVQIRNIFSFLISVKLYLNNHSKSMSELNYVFFCPLYQLYLDAFEKDHRRIPFNVQGEIDIKLFTKFKFSVVIIEGIPQSGPGLPAGGYPNGLNFPSVCSLDDDTGFVTTGIVTTGSSSTSLSHSFPKSTWKYNFTTS